MNVVVHVSINELRGVVSNCTRICRDTGFTADEIPKILGYKGKEELGIEQLIQELTKCRDGVVLELCRLMIQIGGLLTERFGEDSSKKKKWLGKSHERFRNATGRALILSGDVSRLKIVVSLLQSEE